MSNPEDSDAPLRSALRRLPQSVEPDRDLWAGIHAQISAQKPASTMVRTGANGVRWAVAASLVGLAVGVLVTLSLRPSRAPVLAQLPPVTTLSTQPGISFVPASTDAVRRKLRAEVAAQMANLPPATRQKVESNLQLIKNAVADIQSALAKDPGNSLLQDLLVTTYQNELDTLANVQALASSAHPEVST